MKKLITETLIIMFVFVGKIYSQDLIIGIKGGSTTSGLLYSKFTPKPEHRYGFLSGISLLKSISSHVDLGIELIYEPKGYIDHITFTDQNDQEISTEQYIYKFNYMVLPCYISIHTVSKIQLFLNFGLYPAYLVKSMTDVPIMDPNSGTIKRRESKFDSPYLRHFDIGGLIEGGAEFKITDKLLIDLNLRYNNGFLSVLDKQILDQYVLLNSLNFSLGLNYKITGHKEEGNPITR